MPPCGLGPCRVIAPKVVQFSKDYPEVDFYKIDVDQMTSIASELGVRAMPSFYFFKNGEKVGEVIGANPPALKVCLYYPDIYRDKTRAGLVHKEISQASALVISLFCGR